MIDDFAPPASRVDADRQHRVADRLVRGQGNHAGRQRMRPTAPCGRRSRPGGLILATGEDVPRGHSITARLYVLAVPRGDVNLTSLSACPKDVAAGRYAGDDRGVDQADPAGDTGSPVVWDAAEASV